MYYQTPASGSVFKESLPIPHEQWPPVQKYSWFACCQSLGGIGSMLGIIVLLEGPMTPPSFSFLTDSMMFSPRIS